MRNLAQSSFRPALFSEFPLSKGPERGVRFLAISSQILFLEVDIWQNSLAETKGQRKGSKFKRFFF